jgi:hypothetical protein
MERHTRDNNTMKTLILSTLLTLLLFIPTASAQVMPEQRNNNGQTIFRVVNNTNYYTNCFYRDQANYFTFSVSPRSSSMWYPVFGQYQWGCK